MGTRGPRHLERELDFWKQVGAWTIVAIAHIREDFRLVYDKWEKQEKRMKKLEKSVRVLKKDVQTLMKEKRKMDLDRRYGDYMGKFHTHVARQGCNLSYQRLQTRLLSERALHPDSFWDAPQHSILKGFLAGFGITPREWQISESFRKSRNTKFHHKKRVGMLTANRDKRLLKSYTFGPISRQTLEKVLTYHKQNAL